MPAPAPRPRPRSRARRRPAPMARAESSETAVARCPLPPRARARAPVLASRAPRLASASTASATPLVVEPKTGLALPRAMTMERVALALAGLGVRVKRVAGLSVRVYACGLYVDAAAAKRAKARGGDPLEALASCERSVRLVFARDVGGEKVVEALAERIRPKMESGSPALRAFEKIFDGVSFKKGSSLDFTASARNELSTRIRGARVSVIADEKLCKALFDAYLGADPVVPSLKEDVRAFVAKL